MQVIKNRKEVYIKDITTEVVGKIEQTYGVTKKEAIQLFKNTKTYRFLAFSDDPFVEDGPDDFFELYQNEKRYGRMVTNEQLRLEKAEQNFNHN